MNKNFKKYINNFKIQLIIAFFLLSLLFYFFPYTGDDWAWATQVGIERLQSGFANYNGRYVGNLFVLLLSRNEGIKVFLSAFVLVALAYNMFIFVNKQNKKLFWIALLFLLLTPKLIMAQTIVWTSGFTNYVIPTLFIFIYLNMFKYVFNGQIQFKRINCVYAIILGIVNSLIMENITIFNIVISLVFLIYTYWKYKKIDYVQLCFLVASIIGTYIMFTNEAYTSISANKDDYRSITQDGNKIILAINTYFNKFYKMFFMNNYIISISISLIGIVVSNKIKKIKYDNKIRFLMNGVSTYLLFYICYLSIKLINPNWNIFLRYTKFFEGSLVCLWCLTLLILLLPLFKQNRLMRKAFVMEMSFVILLAPLFFVNPIWNRNVFPLYCMLVGLLLCLYEFVKEQIKLKKKYIIVLLSTTYLYLGSIYGYVWLSNERRENQIQIQLSKNTEVMTLKKLPYRDYLWMTEPKGEMWLDRFKLFYGIPLEKEIIFK